MMMEKSKKCPKCGKIFVCQHSASCWCTTIELSDLHKIELAKSFSDCLCKECLEDFSNKIEKEVD